jgi:hypothetical protein
MARMNLLDPKDVSKIISEVEHPQNKERKKREFENYEIYAGRQQEYVTRELKNLFPDSWQTMRVSNINIHKKVTEKKAKAYKNPPKRNINGVASDEVSEFYKKNGFDESLAMMDLVYNRHNAALLWFQDIPENLTEYRLKTLAPYLYDLVVDPDSNKVETVILSYPDYEITNRTTTNMSDGQNMIIAENARDSGTITRRYAMWDQTNHVNIVAKVKMGEDGKPKETVIDYVVDDANPTMVNPWGRLPFYWLTSEPDNPEHPFPKALPKEAININVLMSDVLTASALQGFGQLVLKYPQGSQIDVKHSGFTVMLELPQEKPKDGFERIPTEAEYINANPDIPAMKATVLEYAEAVIGDEGVSNFSLVNNQRQFNSGFDRALASADVIEIREENIQTYKLVEQWVWQMILTADQVKNTRLFNPDMDLSVMFPKPKQLKSEKEVADLAAFKEEKGYIHHWEAVQMTNDDLSEEEAKIKAESIDEDNKTRKQESIEFMQAAMASPQAVQAENESTESELPEPEPEDEGDGN